MNRIPRKSKQSLLQVVGRIGHSFNYNFVNYYVMLINNQKQNLI